VSLPRLDDPPLVPRPPLARRLVRTLGWAALLLALLVARVLYSARAEWRAAHVALEEGRSAAAVIHLRRAASWHVPLSPYRERAFEALEVLAQDEQSTVQSSAERARSAALASSRTALSPALRDPNPWLGFVALSGWLLWSGAAFAFVTRGLDAESRPTPRAWRMLACMAAGFALFALGLAFA
jgi:hypothetical protein